jgi:hypothetical protein
VTKWWWDRNRRGDRRGAPQDKSEVRKITGNRRIDAYVEELTTTSDGLDETDSDRLELLDRIAKRMPELDLDQYAIEWHKLPDGSAALVIEGGGFDGGDGYFIANAGSDLHVIGSTAPMIPGAIGCVVIDAAGSRELVRLIDDPEAIPFLRVGQPGHSPTATATGRSDRGGAWAGQPVGWSEVKRPSASITSGLIVALALLAGCGGSDSTGPSDEDQVSDQATAFVTALDEGDGNAACATMTTAEQEDFLEAFKGFYGPNGCHALVEDILGIKDFDGVEFSSLELGEPQVDGATAVVEVSGLPADLPSSIELENTSEGWLIDESFLSQARLG